LSGAGGYETPLVELNNWLQVIPCGLSPQVSGRSSSSRPPSRLARHHIGSRSKSGEQPRHPRLHHDDCHREGQAPRERLVARAARRQRRGASLLLLRGLVQHRERSFGRIRARGVPEFDADRSSPTRWTGIPELPRRVGALADAHAKRRPAARGVCTMPGWDVQFQSKSEWDVLASPRRRTMAELASPAGSPEPTAIVRPYLASCHHRGHLSSSSRQE